MDIKIILGQGEDGWFVAQCPALKSCWSQGRTREEAIQNIREAIELFLEPDPQELAGAENREVIALAL